MKNRIIFLLLFNSLSVFGQNYRNYEILENDFIINIPNEFDQQKEEKDDLTTTTYFTNKEDTSGIGIVLAPLQFTQDSIEEHFKLIRGNIKKTEGAKSLKNKIRMLANRKFGSHEVIMPHEGVMNYEHMIYTNYKEFYVVIVFYCPTTERKNWEKTKTQVFSNLQISLTKEFICDFTNIETKLQIQLPTFYKEFLTNFPIAGIKESMGLNPNDEGIEDLEILTDEKDIISINEYMRLTDWTRFSLKWDRSLYAIGRDGTGGYYYIDLSSKSENVFFFHIDDNEIIHIANNMHKFLQETIELYEDIDSGY